MSASLAPVLRVLGFGAAGRCTDARAPANSAPLPPALARLPAACPTAGWARGWSNTHPLRASGRGIPGRPGRPSRSGRGRAAAVGEAPGSGEKPGQVVFNHEVVHRIAAPVDRSWVLWSDLSRAPEWMRWIERVEVVEAGGPGLPPRLSRWVCSTGGFEVSWVARVDNIKGLEDHKEPSMEWATIEGLQSTGKVGPSPFTLHPYNLT